MCSSKNESELQSSDLLPITNYELTIPMIGKDGSEVGIVKGLLD